MYSINEQQIDFIINDISARGVETESLQLNLLDHICCIIEQELKENGDFEQFYNVVIRRFYKDKLSEIEEETHLLLNNKNYYVMKKVMIYSGVFSAAALTAGIILKYLQANGASIMVVLGIGIASLIFLPLLVALKVKEKQSSKDKLLVVLGTLSGIIISLGILFKIQHWPGANMMAIGSIAILLLVFLPIYFFGGIRNPETKVNTIVSSVIIILGCGLFFTLTMTPRASKLVDIRNTYSYLRSEQILQNEAQQLAKLSLKDAANLTGIALSKQIYDLCQELKMGLVAYSTGGEKVIDENFESRDVLIGNANTQDYLATNETAAGMVDQLAKKVKDFNAAATGLNNKNLKPIPVTWSVINRDERKVQDKVTGALNDLEQIQMLVLQNERELSGGEGEKGLTAL